MKAKRKAGPMGRAIITGAIAMLIITVIVANLSMVRPRPKPEMPPPTAKTETVVPTVPQPVIILRPPSVVEQTARLQKLETTVKQQRVQARRIDEKLDEFLKREKVKTDAGGE